MRRRRGRVADEEHLSIIPVTTDARDVRPLLCSTMGLYAAYGSNVDPERMARRAPHSPLRDTGWAQGWRLTFGGQGLSFDGAMATVAEEAGAEVFVALYEVNTADESELDQWEGLGIGLYRRVHVRVATLEGEQVAWTYVLDDYEGGLPSPGYLDSLACAAEAGGAPSDYVAALRSRPHSGPAAR